jgi:hypothetical protein
LFAIRNANAALQDLTPGCRPIEERWATLIPSLGEPARQSQQATMSGPYAANRASNRSLRLSLSSIDLFMSGRAGVV